jgi:hypothetical protein
MDIKKFAIYLSKPEAFAYVNGAKDAKDRELRINSLKRKFLEQKSAFADFTGFTDGNPDGVNDDAFGQPERTEQAIFDIKRLCIKHDVRDSTKQYLTSRNSVIKRNKQRKAEAAKLHKNGWQST